MILIQGSGFLGLSLALFFKKNHFPFVICDKNNRKFDDKTDLRTLTLTRQSLDLLKNIDVFPDGGIIQSVHVQDAFLQTTYHSPNLLPLPFAKVVVADALRSCLLDKCNEQGIHIETSVFTPEKAHVFDLVFVAEGRKSHIPTDLNIASTHYNYHQIAYVWHIHHRKPHEQKAFEIFDKRNVFATLPLKDPHKSGIVCTRCESDLFDENMCPYPKELGDTIAITPIQSYPLHGRCLTTFVKENIYFLGDTAHQLHPLAGQSLNLAFRDLIALTRHMIQARALGIPFDDDYFELLPKKRYVTHQMMQLFLDTIIDGPLNLRQLGVVTLPYWFSLCEGL